MEKNGKRTIYIVSMLICVLLAAVMLASAASADKVFADEDEDRGLGKLYILGRKIEESGEVPAGAVPHTGTILYDKDAKTLKLSNVTLDLDNYYMPPETENNYAAAISSWDDLTIELEGANYIKSSTNTYGEDKEYVKGINFSSGRMIINGEGTLDITLQTVSGKDFTGIDAARDIVVAKSSVTVQVNGTEKCSGIDTGISDLMLSDGANVRVTAGGSGSTAVDGSGLFERSYVIDKSTLEMTADGKAFKGYLISDELKETPAKVNTEPTSEGASEWDKTTGIYTYKYVKFEAGEGGGGRAFGKLYILGRQISNSGVVSAKTVPHTGKISYDESTSTITLEDATLDLNDFKSDAVGNIVAGIYSTSSFGIELKGSNTIISTGDDYAKYGDGENKKEYVYGIETWGPVNIFGNEDASLSISFAKTAKDENKSITMAAIDSDAEITVDTVALNLDMGSYGKCSGLFLWGPLTVGSGARVRINADGYNGTAFNGVNAIGNSEIAEGAMLEMKAGSRAFNCWDPSVTLKDTPCWVNTKASEEGAFEWDKKTGLYDYKYVRFREVKHNHVLEMTDRVEPTCTKAGNIKYWKCSDCGKYYSDEEGKTEITQAETVIPAKGHSIELVPLKKATDKKAGNIKYWACKECGTCFSDEAGTTEITKESTVIPKNNVSVKVKKSSYKVKYGKKTVLKAKALYTVKNNKGKVTYKKASGKAGFTVTKNGNITVKKGLKKGSYKVKVKMTDAGNAEYQSVSKTVTVTVKIAK